MRTYVMLSDLGSVFRSLQSELGLRPVFRSTENYVDGHLFITALAYQFVQVIRTRFKQAGIQESWTSHDCFMLAETALICPENCTNRTTITAHFETDENNFRSA